MSTFFNDDEIHPLVLLPPDGGWGYMVVFCSFICHLVIDGTIYTFGLFLDAISEEFGINMAETSLVGSILNGVCYLMGPLTSACVNRFDFRLVALTGCVIAGLAYLISSFSVNYPMFLVGNGILLGLGYGMLYVPALISPSIYFAKYRAIAVSLATCGTGIGTFVMPTIVTPLNQRFGWRNTYLCLIGIVGVAALACLGFIPLQPKRVYTRGDKKDKLEDKTLGSSKMNFKRDNRKTCSCCHWGNTYFPTTTDIVAPRNVSFEEMDTVSEMSSIVPGRTSVLSKQSVVMPISECEKCMACLCFSCCQTHTRAMYRDDIFYAGSVVEVRRNRGKLKVQFTKKIIENRRKKAEAHEKAAAAKAAKVAKEVEKMKAKEAAKTAAKTAKKAAKTAKVLEKKKGKQAAKPEQATTSEMPEEDENTLTGYHMTVTRVTTDAELYDRFTCCCLCACTVSGMRALTSMLDFRIMKSLAFIILCFNGFFFTLGYNIPFMFIVDRATEAGIARNTAVLYLSYIGIANTVARIVVGLVPILIDVNCTVIIVVCCILQGACTACSDFYMTNWYQVLYVCTYGFLAAPYLALRSVIVVDIFGLENLTNIFGLQLVTSGIAAMIGPTVGGMLRDVTNNYTYSFYFAGGCIAFSAFLLAFIQSARKWEIRTGFVHF